MHIIEAISRTCTEAAGLPRASDGHRAAAAPPRAGGAPRALRRLAARLVRWGAEARTAYRRGQARRELSALSDLTLKDIGIARGEIPAVVAALDADVLASRGGRPAVRGVRGARITAGAAARAVNDNASGPSVRLCRER